MGFEIQNPGTKLYGVRVGIFDVFFGSQEND